MLSISRMAFGGWNLVSNRSVYHQRRPTPNSGLVCQMRIDSPNQSTRWKKELNSLPDATWLRTITRMKPIPAATASRMTLERRSRPELWVRITITISAAASPAIACRDWVIAMPTRQIQKQACAKSGGHRTQVGRAYATAAAMPKRQPAAFLCMS